MQKIADLKTMCETLVSFHTASSLHSGEDFSNLEFIYCLANWLDDLHFETHVVKMPEDKNKANLIAYTKNTQPNLFFSGHSDTVPISSGHWHTDPLQLHESGDSWQGLGICDMKAFFPLFLHALQPLLDSNPRLPVGLIATCDEETTMSGARYITENLRFKPKHIVIGEPTCGLPVRAHKGYLAYRAVIKGKSAHSSDPSQGINAIEIMHFFLEKLFQYQRYLEENYLNANFKVPYPTLNVGLIEGGSSINTISDHCQVEFEIRPLPNMDVEAIGETLDNMCQSIGRTCGAQITLKSLYEPVPGFSSQLSSPIIHSCEAICGCKANTVNYTTEAPFFMAKGIDSVVLGPGDIAQAHQPNESLKLANIDKTIGTYRHLINQFCI